MPGCNSGRWPTATRSTSSAGPRRIYILTAGELSAVVVYPDVGYGVYEPYAYPWYGDQCGWEPSPESYDLPYMRDEIAELGTFDHDRLRAPRPGARQNTGKEADLQAEQEQQEEG